MRKLLPLMFFVCLALASACWGQQTIYTIPTGQVCVGGIYNSTEPLQDQGLTTPEHCTYYPTGIDRTNGFGRFQTGGALTQLVFTGELGYYCQNPQTLQSTAVWSITDEPQLGDTAKKYTLDCAATSNNDLPATIHAEIYTYSYVQDYRACSRSGCYITHRVNWAVLDNSFVSLTN